MQSWNLLGVQFARDIQKYHRIIANQYRAFTHHDPDFLLPLFKEENTTHYYITPRAVEGCNQVKLGNTFRYDWVRAKVENGLKQWSFGKKMLRFYRFGNTLLILYAKSFSPDYFIKNLRESIRKRQLLPGVDLDQLDVEDFYRLGVPPEFLPRDQKMNVNYVLLKLNVDIETCEITEGMPTKMPLAQEAFLHFRQMLWFILLSPLEMVVVKPGIKHGTRSSPDRLFNEEMFPMIVVNYNWNRISVREEEFWVRGEDNIGFARQQACGPGRSLRKEMWIDPFKKNGYVRGASKAKQI